VSPGLDGPADPGVDALDGVGGVHHLPHRWAIATYTHPGDYVLDAMCGIGTSLVEAVHQARNAIGVEYERPWAGLARANLTHARAPGRHRERRSDLRRRPPPDLRVDPALTGLVALMLTSPPYGPSLRGQVRARAGKGLEKANYGYSNDPAHVAHVGLNSLLDAMHTILRGAARLLRPGGYVAMTVRPWWHDGALVDLPGAIGRVGEDAGLILCERKVALLAGLNRGGTLIQWRPGSHDAVGTALDLGRLAEGRPGRMFDGPTSFGIQLDRSWSSSTCPRCTGRRRSEPEWPMPLPGCERAWHKSPVSTAWS
jgi:hypothetical protein